MIAPRVVSLASIVVCCMAGAFVLGASRAQSNRPQHLVTPAIEHGQPAAVEVDSDKELLHETSPAAVETETAVHGHSRVVWMTVTAYCSCPKCCGPKARGLTASGRSIAYNAGRFVAADTKLFKFGTQLQVPGYAGGEAVEVIDRGSAIKGYHIDLFFPTHDQAKEWGKRYLPVTVVE
jgi:3D (Asp-Asp-Asp) domain-containing protein